MRHLALVLLVVLLACGPRTLKVTMNPDNNSGQSGFANLTEVSGTRTRIQVSIGASDVPALENAHVHFGHCGNIGAIWVPINQLGPDPADTTLFSSDTTVDAGFSELTTGAYALNVHDSRDNGLYVSCGDLRPAP